MIKLALFTHYTIKLSQYKEHFTLLNLFLLLFKHKIL